MNFLNEIISTLLDRTAGTLRRPADEKKSVQELCETLLTSRGEVSGMSLAHLIHERYEAFNDDEKLEFFMSLVEEMDVQLDVALAALKNYRGDPSVDNYEKLIRYFETGRLQLIRRLNQAHNATAKLVKMREDLTRLLLRNPELKKLDIDFKNLFISWFNRGFLVLRPINWSSPAHILEKIITYESVHEIRSWDDLRRRLQPEDRRCFAFFHPVMPDEPLIFVQVALIEGIPKSVQEILSDNRKSIDPAVANTAAFYSISNCQVGLSGISFGNSLIKTVVQHLVRELPQIKTFITLSPIPGLMKWLEETGNVDKAVTAEQQIGFAAHYLLKAKNNKGRPLDQVARFHLNNGAFISDIHANADISPKGMAQSYGVMVNYCYDLKKISENHEAFANQNKVVSKKNVVSVAEGITISTPLEKNSFL